MFKSKINRKIVQEDWLLKTRNHLEKLEKKLKRKNLKKLRKLCKDNSNLYFACLTRFDSHDEFFDFNHYFFFNFVTLLFQISKTSIILFI